MIKSLLSLAKFLKAPNFVIKSFKDKFNRINFGLIKQLENVYKKNSNNFYNIKKLFRISEKPIRDNKNNLKNIRSNLNKIITDLYLLQSQELNKYVRLLESNSIHQNLKKGYSIISKSNNIIKKSTDINENDIIDIQFIDKLSKFKIKKIN